MSKDNDDLTRPQFIYPPGDQTGQNLTFNYVDTVNISWAGTNPDLFYTQLTVFTSINDQAFNVQSKFNVSKIGFQILQMNLAATYPFTAHLWLDYLYPNGSVASGPNTVKFNVIQDPSLDPAVWPKSSNITTSTVSSTAITVSSSTASQTANSGPSTNQGASGSNNNPSIGLDLGLGLGLGLPLILLIGIFVYLVKNRRSQKRSREAPMEMKDKDGTESLAANGSMPNPVCFVRKTSIRDPNKFESMSIDSRI